MRAEETSLELAKTTAREYSYKVEEIFDGISYVASDVNVVIKRNIEHHEFDKNDIMGVLSKFLTSHENVYSLGIISNLRLQSEKSVESIEVVNNANKSQKESVNLTRERFNKIQNEIDSILKSINVLFEAGENANNAEETSNATDKQTQSLTELEQEAIELNKLSINLNDEVNKFKF